jgi:glycosyltransferase involved in cell wall biosynthesis
MKGLHLFSDVCELLSSHPMRKVAYLSDEGRQDYAAVARARQAGVEIVFGERSPAAIYRDGFLLLVCTDPHLWVETFSMTAAEAMAHLVPSVGTGSAVLAEVVGPALAFDCSERQPGVIAASVADLYDTPRHVQLRQACQRQRARFSPERFARQAEAIIQDLNTHL